MPVNSIWEGSGNIMCLDVLRAFAKSPLTGEAVLEELSSARGRHRNFDAAFERLLGQGWTDAIRALHPDERIYTFWDYFRNAYARDAGLRIDHLLLSPSLAGRLEAAGVDREVRGWDKASDHAPVWIELADRAPERAKPSRPSSRAAG